VDALLGRGRVPPCDIISAVGFHQYFDAKMDGVWDLTADAPPPSFTRVPYVGMQPGLVSAADP